MASAAYQRGAGRAHQVQTHLPMTSTWLWEHRRYRDRITQQRRADAAATLGRINRKVGQP